MIADDTWIKFKPPVFSTHITFQDNGRYYIMQRGFPHYLGEIHRAADEHSDALIIADAVAKALVHSQVTGYLIWITFAGALGGDRMLIETDWAQKLQARITAMADYYLLDRIKPHPEKFKKWLLK